MMPLAVLPNKAGIVNGEIFLPLSRLSTCQKKARWGQKTKRGAAGRSAAQQPRSVQAAMSAQPPRCSPIRRVLRTWFSNVSMPPKAEPTITCVCHTNERAQERQPQHDCL